MLYKASAPGSVMLLGEYAILHGGHALVAAIDKRITVYLTPRLDRNIHLFSENFGKFQTNLDSLSIEPPYQFILAAIQQLKFVITTGFDLKIESEFSAQVGFGSSSAVTVATIAALLHWLGQSNEAENSITLARSAVQAVQGSGSGADVAACTLGGVVVYQMSPLCFEKISVIPPISLIYCGYKTKTADALALMKNKYALFPEVYDQIFSSIDACVMQSVKLLKTQDWLALGKLFNIQQGLMQALGVSTHELDEILRLLKQASCIYGAKISGSGLGDCAVGLGELSPDFKIKYPKLNASISLQGCVSEQI